MTKVTEPSQEFLEEILKFSCPDDDAKNSDLRERLAKRFIELSNAQAERKIDIYEKHVSEESIDAAIEFYSSPMGRAFAAALPGISKEMIRLSAELTEALTEEVLGPPDTIDVPSVGELVEMTEEEFREFEEAAGIPPKAELDERDSFLKRYDLE